jgi:hypothetical protein
MLRGSEACSLEWGGDGSGPAPVRAFRGATFFFGFVTILIIVGGSVLFTYWISKDE